MALIRPFRPQDTEDCKHICRATLPPSLSSSPPAIAMAPYLWTLQFTHLSPQTCFVLDDGTGRVVGYVIGVPDVFSFAEAYPRYVDEVLRSTQGQIDVPPPSQLGTPYPPPSPAQTTGDGTAAAAAVGGQPNLLNMAQQAYKVEWLVLDGVEGKKELVREYRAMMHIDLLEEAQGQGWGRKMIQRFVESVKGSGEEVGRGVQIGVSGENTKVVPFYERVGFRVYPGGEAEGCVWMVLDL